MRLLLIILALFIYDNTFANNYYFSSTSGIDSRSDLEAQNPETPWKTLEKLNAIFTTLQPGDAILLKRGDVFYGSISISKSGNSSMPISLGDYGTGNKPVITGFTSLENWSTSQHNIWNSSNAAFGNSINIVLVDGVAKRVGRFPNYNVADQGFLYYESSYSNTSITDSKLNAPNFTGGEVVIRKTRWVVDNNKISDHSGNVINYTSQSGYSPDKGNGYFFQNHLNTLDEEGEWYYNSEEKNFGIYTAKDFSALSNVKASTVDVLLSISNQNNIVFNNIVFTGANKEAVYIKNSQNIHIGGCEILFSGGNAITADNTGFLTVENSIIDHTNNIAFNGIYCTNTVFKNNKINCTGIYAGMGGGDSGSYEALMISGDDNLIEQNEIDSTGYIPITFNGNNVVIKNNYITNYAFVKDDGGGIYTWNNGSNPTAYNGRKVSGNTVINGIGAAEGTADKTKKFAHGIYIDDNASSIDISANTVANCEGFGLYIHNAKDLSITSNTIYNNHVQLEMQHDNIAPNSIITNNTVANNILFSLLANQPVAEYKTENDDLANFGNFDNNYYCRPIDDNAVINTLKNINGSYVSNQVDLEGWKAMYGKDANSKKTLKSIAAYKINDMSATNKFSNGHFYKNIDGLYSYSPANNCVTQWSNDGSTGGSLKVSFSSIAGNNNKGTIIINVGSVDLNKSYILRLSTKGMNDNKMLEVYLRKSFSPYTDLTDRKLLKIKSSRSEAEFLFVPSETEANASIGIDVPEQLEALYISDIQLSEANTTTTNIEDSVRLIYNASASNKSFVLNGSSIDVKNTSYSSSVSVDAFSSVILLNKVDIAGIPDSAPVVNCAATGNILREVWDNVNGNDLADNNWSSTPTSSSLINVFEGPENIADHYASRIRGYICPPQTGAYVFWIAGDDATELWLSTDGNPGNKVKIAYNVSWTSSREWNKYSTQKSVQIYLEAGKKYYIEALHKEGEGGDNLAVAWQRPNGILEAPIPGSYLSPFTATTSALPFSPSSDLNTVMSSKTSKIKAISPSIRIVPNPITSFATITADVTESGIAVVQLYDMQNKFLKKIFEGYLEKNTKKAVTFLKGSLPAGMYVIKFSLKDKMVTQKIVLTK